MDPQAQAQLRAVVFNVQRFSIHDGPGIRTTVFFKGCPLRCQWCHNPESHQGQPELAFYADRCRASGRCVSVCPNGALELDKKELNGLQIDRQKWQVCGTCTSQCGYGALEVVGQDMSLDQLLAQIRRDLPFYQATDGGVTLSGGEATQQLPFIQALVRSCQERNISVGLQTCGAFRWASVEPLLPLLQFVHYDLKVMAPEQHKRLTGADNRGIIDNATKIAVTAVPVTFRVPLIPGHTDGADNLRAIAAFLRDIDVKTAQLLAYHPLGEIKSRRLGQSPTPRQGAGRAPRQGAGRAPSAPRDRAAEQASMWRAVELFREQGIEPVVDEAF